MKKYVLLSLLTFLLFLVGQVRVLGQQSDEQLGLQYYSDKEYDKALTIFESLYNRSPNQFNYLYYLNTLLEIKEYDKAEKLIKKQQKASPYDLQYQIDYGYVNIMQGDMTKGKKIYDNALKDLKPDQMQVYNLANAFINRREYDYVIRTYQRGRELLKQPAAFAYELAYIYELLGNTELMLNEYLTLLTANPEQMNTVQNRLQFWLSDDIDNSKNEAYRQALLKKLQQNPDEIIYNEMLLWHSIQQKDFPFALVQAKALDRRFNETGKRVFDLAALSLDNGDFTTAIDAYSYVIKKHANNDLVLQSRIELINTEFSQYKSTFAHDQERLLQFEKGYKDLINELGVTPFTIPIVLNLSHLEAFYLNQTDDAISLLKQAIALANISKTDQANCKLELADIYLFSGEQWEATLLYSQVEKSFKNEPLGHLAKFKNAKLSYYIGEFEWAKAQLDVLKAATSKLIANDAMDLSLLISNNIEEDSNTVALSMYSKADLLEMRNHDKEALTVLDSIQLLFPYHPINNYVLFKKAQISAKNGRFEDAEAYYTTIVEKYPEDLLADDALFNVAQLYENQLNNKNKAMQLYEDLLTKYPGSLFVVEARKHFRTLRNDVLN